MKKSEHRWPDNDKSGCGFTVLTTLGFLAVGGLLGWFVSLLAGA